MTAPGIEDGYIRIATELWDALCRTRIPGRERRVLDVIIRRTYGWQRKQDQISLSQFSRATGISRQHSHDALVWLAKQNIIIVYPKTGTSVPKDGYNGPVTYGINKHYREWKMYPKTGTSVPENGYTRPVTYGINKQNRERKMYPKTGTPQKCTRQRVHNVPASGYTMYPKTGTTKDTLKDKYKDNPPPYGSPPHPQEG